MRRLALLAAFCLAFALPAVAGQDVRGVWRLDEPAWQAQMDRLIADMAARLAPEIRASLKAQGIDPEAAMRQSMGPPMNGTVEFLEDGSVRTTTPQDGATAEGRWSLSGSRLRIEVADGGGTSRRLVGSVDGDRMALRPTVEERTPDAAILSRIVVPLVRAP